MFYLLTINAFLSVLGHDFALGHGYREGLFRFHQDISVIESRYSGRFNPNMMGDYCWFLQCETDTEHARKSMCIMTFEGIQCYLCLV